MEPQTRKRMTFRDASIFKNDFINKWKNKLEVWPFAYGDEALIFTSTWSSLYTMYFYRRKLKLINYARLTAYAPVIGMSAILTGLVHEYYVNYNVLSARQCSVCTEVKAGLCQALTACVYPMMISPVIAFYLSDRLYTYAVPPITSAPKEVFKLWQKFTRPNKTTFLALCGIQMIAAMFVTQQKITTLAKLDINHPVGAVK